MICAVTQGGPAKEQSFRVPQICQTAREIEPLQIVPLKVKSATRRGLSLLPAVSSPHLKCTLEPFETRATKRGSIVSRVGHTQRTQIDKDTLVDIVGLKETIHV